MYTFLITYTVGDMCKQVVIKNSMSIWVRPNTMKQNEDCVFCKCHECYCD